MRIDCPYCGLRSNEEFTARGDASVKRPDADAGQDAHFRFVYLRDNPRGRYREYWHHLGGCRAWLAIERDTMTHEIYSVEPVAPMPDDAGNGARTKPGSKGDAA